MAEAAGKYLAHGRRSLVAAAMCGAVSHCTEGGQQCIVPLLSLLREVALECLAQSSCARSHQLDQLLGVAANIFQKVLEVLARKLRKQPDEGLQVSVRGLGGGWSHRIALWSCMP